MIFIDILDTRLLQWNFFRFHPSHLKEIQGINCLHILADNFFVGHFWDGRKTEITNLKLCHLCKCNFLNCFFQLWRCMNKYVPFRQNHESTVVGPRWTWGHFPNWLFNSRAKKVRNEKKNMNCAQSKFHGENF